MASNWKMLEVFETSGFPINSKTDDGSIEISLPTAVSGEVLDAFERREHTAAMNAVGSFLKPVSVAVVGASRRPDSIGGVLISNVLDRGFEGPIYPVNPKAEEIHGLKAYPSVSAIEGPVDLAVVVVPAAGVVDVARDCAEKGVRSLLVISSGFSEVGPEGRARQQELVRICRASGMRLIGPNCLGVLNTAPEVSLNATFSNQIPPSGRVGIMSQSGGMAITLMDVAAQMQIGISSFVSVGNKADISGNDLLEYWEEDPNTGLIVLYLESFGNPRRFARLCRRVSASKPILAVKAGRTPAGSRAASSHTAALLSASDVTVDALFKQAGVIRAETLGELLNMASLIGTQPLPRGNRVVIVTNGGGPGIMCADGCQSSGLEVVELAEELQAKLTKIMPPHGASGNPVDMTAAASGEDYAKVIKTIVEADVCDAIITLFVPALGTPARDVAEAVDKVAAGRDIPVATVFMGARSEVLDEAGIKGGAARYQLPEDAVQALARAGRVRQLARAAHG